MKKLKKLTVVMTSVCLLLSLLFSLSVSAQTTKMITITTNSDINPFIRVFLVKKLYNTGGPFTIKCQVKVENFRKTKATGYVFCDIYDGRDKEKPVVTLNTYTKDTNGWIDMKTKEGADITFNNINKVLIDSTFQEYALFNMGGLYCNATISFRNFRILDASGNLVYSWDTDPDFKDLTNLKNIKGPEPLVMACTFGDGSGTFAISDSPLSDSGTATTTTAGGGPIYEEPTSAPAATSSTKSTAAASSTDITDATTDSTEDGTTAEEPADTTNIASTSVTEDASGEAPESSTGVWLWVGIAVGILILGGAAFLILWKTNRLPWLKKQG